jgi:hypothetical protein
MKSLRDAERVVELCKEREHLHNLASSIRMADEIAVCDPDHHKHKDPRLRTVNEVPPMFRISRLGDELRDLIKREAAEQIAEIDKELKELGVAPDEFEAAAPRTAADTRKQRTPAG